MAISLIILKQTVVMFIYMLLGMALFKGGKISLRGSRDMAEVLLHAVIPAVIISSFCVQSTPQRWAELGVSALVGALAMGVSLLVAHLVFKNHPIDNFAAAFSNCGFIGIPLVRSAVGERAVFYLVGFLALFNIVQWVYGAAVMSGEKKGLSLKSIFSNPYIIAALVGLAIFASGRGDRLPSVVSTALEGVSALNSPLGMLVLGVYLAKTDIRRLFAIPRAYAVSALRLIVIPLAVLAAIFALPASRDIKLTALIAASAPVGANVAVYAQLFDRDYPYACELVTLSTILSVAILPLFMGLAGEIL